MESTKRIALVAHDNLKEDLVEWVIWNFSILLNHQLICTGTTGRLVEETLAARIDQEHPLKHPNNKAEIRPVWRRSTTRRNDCGRKYRCCHILLGSYGTSSA